MKLTLGERVQDGPTLNEVYSNRVVGVSFDGSVVSVTLATARSLQERVGENVEGKPVAVVNNRLALAPTAVMELHRAFGDMITVMEHIMRNKAETIVAAKPKASKQAAN
jgi:hypothetical protein